MYDFMFCMQRDCKTCKRFKECELNDVKKRIKILISELNKRGKNISMCEILYLKVGEQMWEKVGSEYELYERLMKVWEEN